MKIHKLLKISKLLKFAVLVLTVYGLFKAPQYIFHQPIPSSLILMYMVFAVAVILLVMTITEEGTRELFSPIKSLVEDPSKKTLRNIIFVLVPLLATGITYAKLKPNYEAPLELRSVHPAPPSSVKVFGKSVNLNSLINPYRKYEKEDPAKFKQLVKEGGIVYFENCFYCHSDKLDGNGHYNHGFIPKPLPFQGIDTIAQLQESFVFWRISTGGTGMPEEATPWQSAMPVWEHFLTEDDVWKVILFIYDYTGNVPRSW